MNLDIDLRPILYRGAALVDTISFILVTCANAYHFSVGGSMISTTEFRPCSDAYTDMIFADAHPPLQ
ncbi:hypothetical protein ACHAXS_008179 [Conticribra weissflogii]